MGTIGFDTIDNQNMHVEVNGDNPNERKQCVYPELTTARESFTTLVLDSKAGRRVGKV